MTRTTDKKSKKQEPDRLTRGKQFHRKVQKEWIKTAEGARSEKSTIKPSGRKGRMDIFVETDVDKDNLVAVVEIKASDWDRMTLKALHRNVSRQASQIWDYIESQIEQGKEVSPGVIFRQRPKDPERIKLIEELFDDRGIPVVWEDESIEERKVR